jgi:predicted ester cyclase
MSVQDDNIATFKQYVAALPEPDPAVLREKLAAVVAHDFNGTDLPEALRQQGREGLAAFRERANKGGQAGATVILEDIFATSDKVVARMTGTFTPSGSEPFSFELIEIAEIATDGVDKGKIARRWVQFDRTKVLQLLGMSPAQ